jgi:hypothetical protein
MCSRTGAIVEIAYTGSGLRGDSMTLPTEIGLIIDLIIDLSKSQHGLPFCSILCNTKLTFSTIESL